MIAQIVRGDNAACREHIECPQYRIVQKSTGDVRHVHERCQHFRNADGAIARSVGMIQDITERKQAEEALRQLNETLEQQVSERTALAEKRSKQLQALAVELIETEERERRQFPSSP
jgi:uncharacterized membrane protein